MKQSSIVLVTGLQGQVGSAGPSICLSIQTALLPDFGYIELSPNLGAP